MDCEDIADLTTEADRAALGVELADLGCAWGNALIAGREPESWGVVRRLIADGYAGALVPSFANGATGDDQNLVLWRWGPDPPYNVTVYDLSQNFAGRPEITVSGPAGSEVRILPGELLTETGRVTQRS